MSIKVLPGDFFATGSSDEVLAMYQSVAKLDVPTTPVKEEYLSSYDKADINAIREYLQTNNVRNVNMRHRKHTSTIIARIPKVTPYEELDSEMRALFHDMFISACEHLEAVLRAAFPYNASRIVVARSWLRM